MDGFQMDQTVITQLGLLPMGILKRVNGGAGPWLSKSVLGDFFSVSEVLATAR